MPTLDINYIASYIVAALTVALVIYVCNGARKWVKAVNETMSGTLVAVTALRAQVETHTQACAAEHTRIIATAARVARRRPRV